MQGLTSAPSDEAALLLDALVAPFAHGEGVVRDRRRGGGRRPEGCLQGEEERGGDHEPAAGAEVRPAERGMRSARADRQSALAAAGLAARGAAHRSGTVPDSHRLRVVRILLFGCPRQCSASAGRHPGRTARPCPA